MAFNKYNSANEKCVYLSSQNNNTRKKPLLGNQMHHKKQMKVNCMSKFWKYGLIYGPMKCTLINFYHLIPLFISCREIFVQFLLK